MIQQLVDNWIMMIEDAIPDTPPVVRVADFPNPQWEDDGFWSAVSLMILDGRWKVFLQLYE